MIYSPTLRDRNDLLRGSEKQFKISDESAYSIVPSDISTSIYTGRTTDSGVSKVEEDLVYKPLSFENELFTSRVYKRNYAMPAFRHLFKEQKRKPSNNTRPPIVAQETAEDPDGSIAEILTIREPGNTPRWHNKAQLATLIPTEGQSARDQDTSGEITMWPSGEIHMWSHAERSILFAEACEQGNVEMVNTLLKSGQDVHVLVVGLGWDHTFDLSAIHVAAEGGHVQVVENLLRYGANKETLSYVTRKRPLHLAVSAGHLDMVRYLLDNSTNIASKDGDGSQAIHLAAQGGSTEMLGLLLGYGAAIDSAMSDGAQPLHKASQNPDKADAIRFLCYQGANIEAEIHGGRTLLYGVVKGRTPLFCACLHNAVDNMKTLLELGAAHSPQGLSILDIALQCGYIQAIRLLLEHGLDPNGPVIGRPSALHRLTAWDIDLHNSCDLPKYPEIVELLLEHGADGDLQDSNGDTPLHCLCSRSEIQIGLQIQLAKILLRTMRDVDTINFAGRTALGVSVENESSKRLVWALFKSDARLLQKKPGIEIGLDIERSSPKRMPVLTCHLRQDSNTWTKRLGCFQDGNEKCTYGLWEHAIFILRCLLRDPELFYLEDHSYYDLMALVPSTTVGEHLLSEEAFPSRLMVDRNRRSRRATS